MFELGIAKKYLLPRKKYLSRSLIALMSIAVITLVVWLVLLFLSINEGIQKRWLAHLTKLNAPLQITPKEAYYNSYYYLIDEYASNSGYAKKTIREKLLEETVDPFDEAIDAELPISFPTPLRNPDGSLKNLAKEMFEAIEKNKNLTAEEYEVAAGVLKLKLTHYDPTNPSRINPSKTLLSQAAYLKSFCGKLGTQDELLMKAKAEDIEKLIGCIEHLNGIEKYADRIFPYLKAVQFTAAPNQWRLPVSFLPEGVDIPAEIDIKHGTPRCILGKKGNGTIKKLGKTIRYEVKGGEKGTSVSSFITSAAPLVLSVDEIRYEGRKSLSEITFHVTTSLDGLPLSGVVGWRGLTLSHCEVVDHFSNNPEKEPLWPYFNDEKKGYSLPKIDGFSPVIVPKNLRENGTRVGDTGHITYASATATSLQEQERPLFVVGFYDPGAINLGIRFILTESDIVSELNAASTNIPIDSSLKNGVQIWHTDVHKTKEMKLALETALQERGLAPYFAVTAFYEYDQVKELLQQFQSDQYLFTLVAIIILVVACSNIITLSVLLVNDKKKEIGILRSMGATTKSIALIFGLCGALMGLISTGLGVALAYLTLRNIDTLIGILSSIQGHQLFTEAFYGSHLPNTLSKDSLLFVGIVTPLIALCAGLVPAVKACRLKTASILRGEA